MLYNSSFRDDFNKRKQTSREDEVANTLRNSSKKTLLNKDNNANSGYGDASEKTLNKYMQNKPYSVGKTRTGLIAPFNDMRRNYDEMKKEGIIGGDKFFHCRANYEAAKRGKYGKIVAKTTSFIREIPGVVKYGIDDSLDDWKANKKGWEGAEKGLTLEQACPRHPLKYK